MRLQLNLEQIERKLRDKERTIAMRLDRLLRPRRRSASPGRPGPGRGSPPWSRSLLVGGAGLVLLGALERPPPSRSPAMLHVSKGRLALFVGVTFLAYVAARHLAEKRAVLVAPRTSSPPAGAPP